MIEKDIRDYAQQFAYEPKVENEVKFGDPETIVIGGMGGSGLVAGVLRAIKPKLNIITHHEYDLPHFISGGAKKYLLIAVSYSGNTEETIDFYKSALKKKLPTAVITSGGELLKLAKKDRIPYVALPKKPIQPRMTLGYMLRAVLKLLKEEKLYKESSQLTKSLDPESFEKEGKALAKKLSGKVPVIYSSRANHLLAYNWKIKLNETGKIPAFYNTLPELNHNEMNGFDIQDKTKKLSEKFHILFLADAKDHIRIKKRMEATAQLYEKRGLGVDTIRIKGENRLERVFNTLILGDWVSYGLALSYGVEPEKVPMIEEFKKNIQ